VQVGAHIWIYSEHQKGFDATPVLDQVFRELSAAGIDGVELMHGVLLHDDQAVPRVRSFTERYRLPVIGSSWEAPMWNREEHDKIVAQAHTVIGRLAELKGQTLGISVGDAHHKKTPDELDAQADVLRDVLSICKDKGITPNLHNHTYEVADGEWDLKGSLERVPGIKLGPDLDWLHKAGVDPVDFIRRYRDRIVFAHLRNRKADGTWPEDMTEGVIDYAAIGRLLHQVGFSGHLMIELAHEPKFTPTRTYGESVRISREYVRRVMGY
jgi:sugar phosphate isomerase/epimerase